jgi:hypothetical protein
VKHDAQKMAANNLFLKAVQVEKNNSEPPQRSAQVPKPR